MFPPTYIADFPLLSRNVMISFILGTMNTLIISRFENDFMYCRRIIVGETVSPQRLISCLIVRIML